ncbi:DNA primase [Candidatus Shapirobacteria bacterium]|nr:DNA primase [Candidatus Shapirobacteria bacterium]
MESQVQEIKQKLDIVEIIGKFLPLKKRGRHYLTNCPFHGEKTPSFTISPELQIFKCFGCGKAGDVFTFIQEYEHVDFKDALEDLAKVAGIVLKKDPHLTQVEKLHRRLIDLNQEAAKFYHYILTAHPLGKPALDYLLNRHITLDTIKTFRLGYSPSNPELVSNYLQKKGFTKAEMLASGTYGTSRYGNSMYDRFLGRVIFPQSDFRDRILGFSGRILPSDKSQNQAKYINSPETDIYHKSQMLYGINLAREEIKRQKSTIIVEGEFDMISPYQEGIKNIVAIKGTAFTTEQLQLLHRYTDTLILALDEDLAGTNASLKSIEVADTMGFDIHVIDLQNKFKDPDEAIMADPQFFKTQLATPVPIWDFIINSALKSHDSSTPKGKQDILRQVLPFLAKISNLVTRSDYLSKLASQLGSSPEAVIAESQKYKNNSSKLIEDQSLKIEDLPAKIPKMDILEEHLLSLIFSAKKPYLLATKITEHFAFITQRYQKVFSYLLKPRKNFVAAKFASRLPPELSSVFQDIFLHSTQFEFDSHSRLSEINKTINQIKSITYKDQLTTLSTKIAQAENQGEEEIVKKLEQDYNHILSELSQVQSTKR